MEKQAEGARKAYEYGQENKIDWGRTASDYTRYRAGFPAELFVRLERSFGVGLPDQRVLDIGTGTGTVARQLAKRGCSVTGLDPSAEMMEGAKALDEKEGVRVTYVQGKTEDTQLPTASFEVVTAGTCWHWFDSHKAFAEVARLLVEGGRLVICHFDWLPIKGSIAWRTEQLVLRHNPKWNMNGGTGFYPQWTIDAAECGFTHIETFSFDVSVPYSHEAWRGRLRAMGGIAAALTPDQVARFDRELDALLREHAPDEPLFIPHRVWAMIATRPAK